MLRKLTIALTASIALGVAAQSASAQTRQIVIEPQAPVASLGTQKADPAAAATPDVAAKAAETDVAPVAPDAAPKSAEKAPEPADEPAQPKFVHPPVYAPSYGNGYHGGGYGYRNYNSYGNYDHGYGYHDHYGSYGYRSYGHRGGGC